MSTGELPRLRSDPRPLYARAEEALGALLADYGEGARLPPEPELAHRMGISRATLREAMRTFEERGQIVRKQGVGTFISRPLPVITSGLEVLESIQTLAARIGLKVKMGALEVDEHLAGPEEALNLGTAEGTAVLQVDRVMLAEERPVAFLRDTVPAALLCVEDLAQGFSGSVLDLLLGLGALKLNHSRTQINALSADARLARRLAIQRGEGLLHFESWLYDTKGNVADYSHSYFVPGYFKFDVIRRVGRGW